jgi:AAA ATPase domain
VRLLEKEPDNRYQTADGLVYDLEQVRDARSRPAQAVLRVGERDVPMRLLPPSRLAGREEELAALEAAFDDALAGRCRGMLVGGAPGVGKTALVNELRLTVTGGDGWFVTGKFDGYRRTWSSTRPIRRSVHWDGCCWRNRTMSWPRCARACWKRWARTRAC